jgi:hypothetical protein
VDKRQHMLWFKYDYEKAHILKAWFPDASSALKLDLLLHEGSDFMNGLIN